MTAETAAETAAQSMLLTYKFRLLPEKRQHRALERILEQQRQLYNGALDERIACYEKTGRSISEVEQSRSLTVIRADDGTFADVQRRIQRATLKRLDRAYKAFFKRAKAGAGASSGFPKFKGREHFDGFAFDAFAQIAIERTGVRFSGMPGKLRFWRDRPLPEIADPETGELRTIVKGVWFKREGNGRATRWFIGFQCETPIADSREGMGDGAIGVDWGTSALAALSSGEAIPNPRHGEVLAADLARAQRAVARKRTGSRGRMKARRHLAAVQRRIANRRRNTMDKVSKRLVTHFGTVASEKVEARKLMNAERTGETLPTFVKRRRNREALDAAPYLLRQMTDYKARRWSARHIEIDPKAKAGDGLALQPTQRCSFCGKLHFKELSEAEHICSTPGPHFSMALPRKVNAARVILQAANGGHGISSSHVSDMTDVNRAGPVPGGLDGGSDPVAARNGRIGGRRPGNTEERKRSTGRRSVLLTTGASNGAEPPIAAAPDARGTRSSTTRPRRTSGW